MVGCRTPDGRDPFAARARWFDQETLGRAAPRGSQRRSDHDLDSGAFLRHRLLRQL